MSETNWIKSESKRETIIITEKNKELFHEEIKKNIPEDEIKSEEIKKYLKNRLEQRTSTFNDNLKEKIIYKKNLEENKNKIIILENKEEGNKNNEKNKEENKGNKKNEENKRSEKKEKNEEKNKNSNERENVKSPFGKRNKKMKLKNYLNVGDLSKFVNAYTSIIYNKIPSSSDNFNIDDQCYFKYDNNFLSSKNYKAVFVIGAFKTGKSTLINYLLIQKDFFNQKAMLKMKYYKNFF